MKFAFACLIASLSLVAVCAEDIMDREGHLFEHRRRLGHLKDKPFIDLYKNYAAAFVLPNNKGRVGDDYRNYVPSGDECITFFRKFRIDEYVVRDLDQFVVLDACLGYLFESTHQEEDRKRSKHLDENLDYLLKDEKLQALYRGTKIEELKDPAKECIGNLLLNIIQAKNQFKDVTCNNHYIQVFVQFADCHSTIPSELTREDTYLKAIYDLVKKRANHCFTYEIKAINRAVRADYASNPFWVFYNGLWSKFKNPLRKQTNERMYPEPIVKLLSTFEGAKGEISLREVHNIIRGVTMKEENFVHKLLTNMANGATSDLKPTKGSNSLKEDPSGSETYRRYVDKLCTYFRRSDRESKYDYATPIIRMNRLLSYPEVFGMTSEQFIEPMLTRSYESGALYLSVCACNVLTFTEAVYDEPAHNAKLKFVVSFKPDTSEMIRWPDAGYY